MATSRGISTRSSSHKFAAAVALAVLLGACSHIGSTDLQSLGQIANHAISPERVSLNEAAAVPYASIGLRLGGSSEAMLVLGSNEGGEQLWTSAARIVIVTKNGRITRTGGLGQNLGGSQIVSQTQNPDGSARVRWLADFPDHGLFGIAISCVDEPPREETIEVLGKALKTVRIDEKCSADDTSLDWSFRNVFWRDPASGFVWRSYQHVNPRLAVLKIETFRPPQ